MHGDLNDDVAPRAGGPPERRHQHRRPETAVSGDRTATVSAWVLLAALSAGLFRQGAYFSAAQWSVGLLVAGALLVALTDQPLSIDDFRVGPVPCLLALGGWALVDGAVRGAPAAASRPALLVAALVAVLLVCRRLTTAGRTVLRTGITAVALAVAAAGWAGVVFRIDSWGLLSQGLWRASSTLTYPNAAAAVLVPVTLLAVATLGRQRRSVPLGLATTGLLVGVGATLSRAGVLALVAGTGVLAVLLGVRAVLGAGYAPAVGAAVALLGLSPSVPAAAAPAPLLATGTLLAGLAVAVALPRLPPRRAGAAVLALVLCGLLAVLGVGGVGRAVTTVADSRATAASADRVHALRAALGVFADHPLAGAGPGRTELRWTAADGAHATLRYAHDEYLQVAADLGVVGLALLALLAVALVRFLRRARDSGAPRPVWAGVVAGVVALAVHSGLDFVWHVPAIPLTAAALVGLVAAPRSLPELPAPAGQCAPQWKENPDEVR